MLVLDSFQTGCGPLGVGDGAVSPSDQSPHSLLHMPRPFVLPLLYPTGPTVPQGKGCQMTGHNILRAAPAVHSRSVCSDQHPCHPAAQCNRPSYWRSGCLK